MLSDITAAPMEMTLLGVQGKVSKWLLRTPSSKDPHQEVNEVFVLKIALLGTMQVHEGMMSAATFVHCNTVEALEAAAQQFPGWPVMVTGHSYGGMAQPHLLNVPI